MGPAIDNRMIFGTLQNLKLAEHVRGAPSRVQSVPGDAPSVARARDLEGEKLSLSAQALALSAGEATPEQSVAAVSTYTGTAEAPAPSTQKASGSGPTTARERAADAYQEFAETGPGAIPARGILA